jgi:hypothetical protein
MEFIVIGLHFINFNFSNILKTLINIAVIELIITTEFIPFDFIIILISFIFYFNC